MRWSTFRAQRPGKGRFLLLGLVLVPMFILLVGAPAWANTVSGIVQGYPSHFGIDGVTMHLVEQTMPQGGRPTSTVIAVTQTANGGTFSFSGLHNGTYLVATSQASALGWIDKASPAFVLLSSDKYIGMELDGARIVSGHVVNIAGQPLANVDMLEYREYDGYQGRALFQTAADGSFSINEAPSRLKLQIGISKSSDPLSTLPPGYLPQWYNDKPDKASADVIDLRSGSQTGLTIVIQGTRTISGHVTDSSGKPVANVRVEAHVGASGAVKQMITAADGFYQLSGLPPVVFRLFANDQSGTLLSEWYQDRSSFSTADGVNLAGGDSTVDFSMSATPTTTTSSTTSTTLPTTTTTTTSTTTTTTQPSTSAFTDVGSSNPYFAAIQGMANLGIISGYDLGGGLKEFRPANDVLRAQFAKMVDGALGIPVSAGMSSPFTDLGSDVPGTFYPVEYVAAVYANGITQGITATTFGPFISIPRAQVVTMVVRALQHLRPGVLATPPATYVNTWGVTFSAVHGENARIAEFNGLLAGLPLSGAASDPWGAMPRGEVAQVLWNVMRK